MNFPLSTIKKQWRTLSPSMQRGTGAAFAVLLSGCTAYVLGQLLVISGVQIGLDFLWQPAGFAADTGLFGLLAAQPAWQAFQVGICNTLAVALLGIVLATVLGVLLGIGHHARNALVREVCHRYVQCVQNVPLLLQLLLWYACLTRALPGTLDAVALGPFFISKGGVNFPVPAWDSGQTGIVAGLLAGLVACGVVGLIWRCWAIHRFETTGRAHSRVWIPIVLTLTGWAGVLAVSTPVVWDHPVRGIADMDNGGFITIEFLALWLGLSCHGASLIAEVVRSGMARVPRGQSEAACALGLDRWQILRLVTLPQALRDIVDPLCVQYISLVKNSSLAVAIGYPDVLSMATMTLHHTGRVAECITLMLLIYMIILVLFTGLTYGCRHLFAWYQPWQSHHYSRFPTDRMSFR